MLQRDLERFSNLFWQPRAAFRPRSSDVHRFFRAIEPAHTLDRQAHVSPALPALNVWTHKAQAAENEEVPEHAVARVAMPGFNAESITVSVQGKTLTIAATLTESELPESAEYIKRERHLDDFERTIALPFEIEADDVSASYEHGMLEVRLPRVAAERPRQVKVLTAAAS